MADVKSKVCRSDLKSKVLPCAFLTDVLCSFRKSEEFGIMDRCLKCKHYLRFMAEMQAAEEKEDAEFFEESEPGE
jgi:hypothetical protein